MLGYFESFIKMDSLKLEEGSYVSRLLIKNNKRPYLIGLCTGWDEINAYKDLDIDVIGTLYTKNGAHIVLRNLLANPCFKVLVILDTNVLGKNNVGNKGLKLLYDIFIGSKIDSVEYYMCNLIDNIQVHYLTENKLYTRFLGYVGESDISYTDIKLVIQNLIHSTDPQIFDSINREKIIYQPDKIEQLTYIPNDYIGKSIRGESIFDAWFRTLEHVYKYGFTTSDDLHEYHSIHWNFPVNNMNDEISHYRTIITQPDVQQMFGLDEIALSDYSKTMNQNIFVPTSAYTYGSRLAIYKDRITRHLRENIRTRYAFGTTIQYDKEDRQAPCLVYVQLLYDNVNDVMNLYAIFRSHDMFKAAFMNAYALGQMLTEYCDKMNVRAGRVEITSISAHIYKIDVNNVKQFIECLTEHMKHIIHYDPHGNCIIQKLDGTFHCDIREPKENKLIFSLEGTNKEIFRKILGEKIITGTEHLEYIFEQLFATL